MFGCSLKKNGDSFIGEVRMQRWVVHWNFSGCVVKGSELGVVL